MSYTPTRWDIAADENDAMLTTDERKAIMALHRLAKRWPKTLTLVSMAGALHVIRTDDERFQHWDTAVRAEAVIQTFQGIPNDGGDW
jgi:hypothetical protein